MQDSALLLVTLGATFLLGLAASVIGQRTLLPRVTMLLVLGFLVGPGGFNLLPEGYENLFQRGAEIALTMVGFLLGGRLVHSLQQQDGRMILWISVSAVVITALVVFVGLWALGLDLASSLLLAGIATATAPAATVDIVRQSGASGRFSDTLLGVVAVDDAWGLLSFSLLMAVARLTLGEGASAVEPLAEGLWELGGAMLIGGSLGGVMAYLTGRIEPGEPTLLEALGLVFLLCGICLWSGVSFILAAMVMGAVVARLAKHHDYPFHSIQNIELPFMILFFVFAGASLDLEALRAIGWIGGAYVILRIIGRLAGGWVGGTLGQAPAEVRKGIGLAMMPQAGVALGMALLAEQKFPEVGTLVLQVAVGSTVFFELVGPLATRYILARSGEG